MIDVEISNVVYEYEDGTTLYEIAKDFGDYYENDIILAVCNGKLCELSKVLIDNSKVSLLQQQIILVWNVIEEAWFL